MRLPEVRPTSGTSSATTRSINPALDDDDSSVGMPTEFYANVDAFLGKPPPNLKTFSKSTQSLPALRKQRSDLRKGVVRRPPKPRGAIDPSTVEEAMRYVDNLRSEKTQSSQKMIRPPAAEKTKRRSTANATRKQQQQHVPWDDDHSKVDSSRRGIDAAEIDRLVKHFQSGAGLTDLRKQLHESQKAMHHSQSVLTNAAKSFHKQSKNGGETRSSSS